MSEAKETHSIEILRRLLDSLKLAKDGDIQEWAGESPQEGFVQLLKIVVKNAILYDHPYILGLESWFPVDEKQNVHPRFVLPQHEVKNWQELSPEQQLVTLYVIARILKYLHKFENTHGHLGARDVICQVPSEDKLRIRLAYWDDDKDDLDAYKDLWKSSPLATTDIDSFDAALAALERMNDPALQEAKANCEEFEEDSSKAQIQRFLSTEFSYQLVQSNGREKWRALRSLVKFASEKRLPDLFRLLGFIYRDGIGVERDLRQAILYFSEVDPDDVRQFLDENEPMTQGMLHELEGDYAKAIESYKQCENLLGVAHIGGLLLRSEDGLQEKGVEILRHEKMQKCGFAKRTLGDYFMHIQKWEDAAEQYRMAAEAGDPDSKFLQGVAYVHLGADRKKDALQCLQCARDDYCDDRAQALIEAK